jgi:DNA topoisomerase-6 subunit B
MVMFHLASTRVPFKTAGKEFIADIPEMRKDFKSCLQACLRSIQKDEESRRREADLAHIRNAYAIYIPLFYKLCLGGLKRQPRKQPEKELGSWID